ncbi:MAG: hypothetical protein P1Q69_02090 [Candidatus Thorarchaeota archaeon]|nr:hypothetical protein [Candidatus Thorarchaeota archaeon]
MNEIAKTIRSKLLGRYYKTAALGWFEPKSLHWAKIVTQSNHWKWIRADKGIRRKLLIEPPLHVYQTVLGIKANDPPRGNGTSGYFFGGQLLFDLDFLDKYRPFSLWGIVDAVDRIGELKECASDFGLGKIERVMFSGSRGIHVSFKDTNQVSIPLDKESERWRLRSFKRTRKQIARSIGYWCKGWDWKVTSDIWRVSRVPLSIHGFSSLRAIPLYPPYSMSHVREQMSNATVFSLNQRIKIRTTRATPSFSFVDGEVYGPYGKGWATKLPISVALHLIWQGYAKLRDMGPISIGRWFSEDWQILFRYEASSPSMGLSLKEGLKGG